MGQKNCKPQPGDLIEIVRPGYQHWALYVGDGYVIHLTGDGASFRLFSASASGGTRAKVIIRRAELCIDKELRYDVLRMNCEHFVTMLRYGEALCEQVKNAILNGEIVAGIAILAVGVIPPFNAFLAACGAVVTGLAAGFRGVGVVVQKALSQGKSKRSYH
ncbi:phospholipase A and acyltransferase 1-like isoform X2 [Melospiza melodia melodia]|uniref:phospholipase A and acyltransferase 1-like isoform X2 n=1 Tax=Melospiza melodia melodia TaxID=1914991 RepID=UPI002FD70763